MKKILTALAVVAVTMVAAPAQQYSFSNAYTSGTNSIATNGVATNNFTITATKFTDVGLAVTERGASGATGNVTATFARSLDATNWVSSPTITVEAALSGTSLVTVVTNLPLGSVGYLRLTTISNGSANSVATNVAVTFSRKP